MRLSSKCSWSFQLSDLSLMNFSSILSDLFILFVIFWMLSPLTAIVFPFQISLFLTIVLYTVRLWNQSSTFHCNIPCSYSDSQTIDFKPVFTYLFRYFPHLPLLPFLPNLNSMIHYWEYSLGNIVNFFLPFSLNHVYWEKLYFQMNPTTCLFYDCIRAAKVDGEHFKCW